MHVALITGGSKGFGRAVAADLVGDGWTVIVDGRDPDVLATAAEQISGGGGEVIAIPGDVADRGHRRALVEAAAGCWPARPPRQQRQHARAVAAARPRPLPARRPRARCTGSTSSPRSASSRRRCRCSWRRGGVIVNITSDAAVEGYEGWGGYGSSKAALDQIERVLAAEHPELRVYGFDPGDMRTQMHQDAFPGEDISDRPEPETVVPALRRLLAEAPAERSVPGRRRDRRCPPPAPGHDRPRRGRRPPRLRPTARSRGGRTPRGAGPDPRRGPHARRRRPRRLPDPQHLRVPARLPRSGRPRRRQHVGDDPGRRRRVRFRRHAARPAPLDAARRRPLGRRAPPRRRSHHGALATDTARCRGGCTSPRTRGRRRCSSNRTAMPAGSGSPSSRSPCPCSPGSPSTAGPIRYGYVERPWPISAYQNVYATEPGQRRDAERRAPVHRRGDHPARRQGCRRDADRAPHRRRLARGRRAAVPGAGPGAGRDGRPGERDARPPAVG